VGCTGRNTVDVTAMYCSVLLLFDPRIRDLGWKKNPSQDPGSGMKIPDLIFDFLEIVFWVKNT
jgi:hypothetical protein